MRVIQVLLLLSINLLGSFLNLSHSSESTVRLYQMENVGTISISTPKSWKENIYPKTKDAFPITLYFEPDTGTKFNVGFSISRPFAKTELISRSKLKEMTEKAAARYKDRVIEKELILKEFSTNKLSGYYFEATDRSPEPDGYKYMTYGYTRAYDFLVWFIVLSNDKSLAKYEQAINVLETMRLSNTDST